MVYVPALGKAIVSRNVLPGPMKRLFPSTVPSGLTIESSAKANVAFDACRLTRCPAAPGKVTRAFCPGAVVATETAAPPAVVLAAASGGTSNNCTVIEPVELASGATLTVYAPVTGSVVVSTNPPPPPAYELASDAPLGDSSETCPISIVTFVNEMLTRSPAVPLNLSGIDSPATDVTVTGGPPGEIESEDRPLPVTLRVVDLKPLPAVTEKVTAPPAVGVNVPV